MIEAVCKKAEEQHIDSEVTRRLYLKVIYELDQERFRLLEQLVSKPMIADAIQYFQQGVWPSHCKTSYLGVNSDQEALALVAIALFMIAPDLFVMCYFAESIGPPSVPYEGNEETYALYHTRAKMLGINSKLTQLLKRPHQRLLVKMGEILTQKEQKGKKVRKSRKTKPRRVIALSSTILEHEQVRVDAEVLGPLWANYTYNHRASHTKAGISTDVMAGLADRGYFVWKSNGFWWTDEGIALAQKYNALQGGTEEPESTPAESPVQEEQVTELQDQTAPASEEEPVVTESEEPVEGQGSDQEVSELTDGSQISVPCLSFSGPGGILFVSITREIANNLLTLGVLELDENLQLIGSVTLNF